MYPNKVHTSKLYSSQNVINLKLLIRILPKNTVSNQFYRLFKQSTKKLQFISLAMYSLEITNMIHVALPPRHCKI